MCDDVLLYWCISTVLSPIGRLLSFYAEAVGHILINFFIKSPPNKELLVTYVWNLTFNHRKKMQ